MSKGAPRTGRGNSYDRRARREWLINERSGFGGDGATVPCYWCGCALFRDTMTIDRYPQCGHKGGSYCRQNIVPACEECNTQRCVECQRNGDGRRRG